MEREIINRENYENLSGEERRIDFMEHAMREAGFENKQRMLLKKINDLELKKGDIFWVIYSSGRKMPCRFINIDTTEREDITFYFLNIEIADRPEDFVDKVDIDIVSTISLGGIAGIERIEGL